MLISRRKNFHRTTGFYGHFPKIVNNRKLYNFDNLPTVMPWEEWDEFNLRLARHQQLAERWSTSLFPYRISYRGYLAYVGKNKTYKFWYMGNPYRPGRIFESHPSARWRNK